MDKKQSFFAYLESLSLVGKEQLEIIEKYKFSRATSILYEMLEHREELGLDEVTCLKAVRGWYPDIKFVKNLSGFKCDSDDISALSVLSDAQVNKVAPLRSTKTGDLVIVSNCIDDDALRFRISDIFKSSTIIFCVCEVDTFAYIQKALVEPNKFTLNAMEALQHDDNNNDGKTSSNENTALRRLYRNIILEGYRSGASDLHFIIRSDKCRVSMRVDGDMRDYTTVPCEFADRMLNFLKIDGKVAEGKPWEPVDGKVLFEVSRDKNIELRFNAVPSRGRYAINIRYLATHIYDFEDLGISTECINRVKRSADRPQGLLILTGPVGSGKTTTLYSIIDYLYRKNLAICTAEDPVEIVYEGIVQVNISDRVDNSMTFADALKSFLRHDANVVVVGELRDIDTARNAVVASNTGALVISTLHTTDSIGAFGRLYNLGLDPYSVGEVCVATMSQRLVKRLCPHCKKKEVIQPSTLIASKLGWKEPTEVYKPQGCIKCKNTGYSGRASVMEVLELDRGLRNLVQTRAPRQDLEEYVHEHVDFCSMYQDAVNKVLDGVTSLDEITKFIDDTIAFKG